LSAAALVKAYQADTERKKDIIRRTQATQNSLRFIAEAMRKLLEDEKFEKLLQKEKLNSIPENIARRLGHLGVIVE
jgi:ParB family chromosome partitioning protein